MSKHDDDTPRPQCSFVRPGGRRCSKPAQDGSTRCWHHGFKVPGRPTKLNAKLSEQIIMLVVEGNYLTTSAQACGVSERTLFRWLERADHVEAAAMEHVDPELPASKVPDLYELVDPADWVYLDFRHALKSAEAYAETELLRQAKSGGMGWQAPMTVLERRHASRWRRSEHHEHAGAVEVRAKSELVVPDDEKRAKAAAILAAAKVPALEGAGDENTPTEEDHDGKD